MPRLNVVDPEKAQGELKGTFDQLKQKHGKVLNIFKGMSNSPAALEAYLAPAAALAKGQLSPQDREVVYLAVSQNNGCQYCLSAHTGLAKKAGFSDDEVLAVRRSEPTAENHKALLRFVLRVIDTKGFVDDADLAAVRRAGYTDGQIAEAIAFIGLATYSNLFNHVFSTPLDLPAAPEI
jgi:uncharacterized peroxidase-related enzyme